MDISKQAFKSVRKTFKLSDKANAIYESYADKNDMSQKELFTWIAMNQVELDESIISQAKEIKDGSSRTKLLSVIAEEFFTNLANQLGTDIGTTVEAHALNLEMKLDEEVKKMKKARKVVEKYYSINEDFSSEMSDILGKDHEFAKKADYIAIHSMNLATDIDNAIKSAKKEAEI